MRTGIIPFDQQPSIGNNTVNSMSMDTLTWHLVLLLLSVGLAYIVSHILDIICPKMSVPLYGIALLCGLFVQKILDTMNISHSVDRKIMTHIGSSTTDFLVAFGIASINCKVVLQYITPIVVLSVLGIIWVLIWQIFIMRHLFKTYWFERGIYIYGLSSGVFATGVILLKMCDPEFKTGVLEDFGLAWIFLSIVDMTVVSLAPVLVLSGYGILFGLIACLTSIASICLCRHFYWKKPA